jgi:hypothetical protein
MSVFAQAAAALHAATAAANGGVVTYRNAAGSVPVSAAFGRSTLVEDDATSARIEVAADDFIVLAAALVIGGAAITPEYGDSVVVPTGLPRAAGTYELMTPPFSPSGPSGALVRLHTKFVGS